MTSSASPLLSLSLIRSTQSSTRSWLSACTVSLLAMTTQAAMAKTIEPGEEARAIFASTGATLYAPPTITPETERRPYEQVIIRNISLIDGTGSPAYGPVDIIIDHDRIAAIQAAHAGAGIPAMNSFNSDATRIQEIDGSGKFALPGFVDAHVHTDVPYHSFFGELPSIDYVFKLWLGHGITTVREAGSMGGLGKNLNYKKLSEDNAIVAPRMSVMPIYPMGMMNKEKDVRQWVKAVKKRGADGIKILGGTPTMLQAMINEANKQGMKTAFHHPQLGVTHANALDSAGWGNSSIEHWYGVPEAMFEDKIVQHFSENYNYSNEEDRFSEAGQLWSQAAQPGSEKWNQLITQLLKNNVTLNPTFSTYEANRDVMAVSRREWFDEYSIPAIDKAFQPNYKIHGSYFFDWTTQDEINWKHNFTLWMEFVNDYKNQGGQVTVGSDAGFIHNLFGFGYIRGLEMLQEAGFHPLEVIQSATMNGAELLDMDDEIGTIALGKKADLVIVDENPLANLKLLYGTKHTRLDIKTNTVQKVGGVRYTIKDGIVYDARELLADVRKTVAQLKAKEGQTSSDSQQ